MKPRIPRKQKKKQRTTGFRALLLAKQKPIIRGSFTYEDLDELAKIMFAANSHKTFSEQNIA